MRRFVLLFATVSLAVIAVACIGCSSVGGSSSGSGASSPGGSADGSGGGARPASSSGYSSSSSRDEAVELQIYADESLSKALKEAQDLYSAKNPNITFAETSFVSSGDLNSMVESHLGAVDIEIAADRNVIDKGIELKLVERDSRNSLFSGNLVLVTSLGNEEVEKATFGDIATGLYSICVGNDDDPVGTYANQSLDTIGCFANRGDSLGGGSSSSAELDGYVGTPIEGKVTLGTTSGDVCKLAEAGKVDVALTYRSDFERFAGLRLLDEVPDEAHERILYQSGICAQAPHADEAERFIDWCLMDDSALEVWQKWGFELAA